jgi:chromatin remodeling complex protein RSC6
MAKTKNSAPKGAKKSSTKKVVSIPVVETPDVETPVVDTPVVDSPVVDAPVVEGYDAEFSAISEQLKVALTLVKDLTVKFNALEKRVSRDRKVMDKKMKGRVKRVKDPNAPPSGFAKPGPVSDELRKFLGLGKDELISRTQVTKKFTEYCKAHDLQNGPDKRVIFPDKNVIKLLRLTKDNEPLTFFNLQKYMKVHYPNKEGVFSN